MKNQYTPELINKYRKELFSIAAIMIFIYHIWNYLFSSIPYLSALEIFTVTIGEVGVDIFVILSGMGCYYSFSKYLSKGKCIRLSIFEFYKRRISRVYIPFFIVMTARFFIGRCGWSFLDYFKIITFYSNLRYNMFASPWFCFGIIVLYLVFPLYYYFFNKSHNKFIFTFSVIELWLAYTMLSTYIFSQRLDLYYLTNRIPAFVAGILLAYNLNQKNLYTQRI